MDACDVPTCNGMALHKVTRRHLRFPEWRRVCDVHRAMHAATFGVDHLEAPAPVKPAPLPEPEVLTSALDFDPDDTGAPVPEPIDQEAPMTEPTADEHVLALLHQVANGATTRRDVMLGHPEWTKYRFRMVSDAAVALGLVVRDGDRSLQRYELTDAGRDLLEDSELDALRAMHAPVEPVEPASSPVVVAAPPTGDVLRLTQKTGEPQRPAGELEARLKHAEARAAYLERLCHTLSDVVHDLADPGLAPEERLAHARRAIFALTRPMVAP
ncbi:MAG: hypothetical protein H6736_17120 [Alphaproteobacteria bacterium]|nr:hypothetical protein [Alphaproteobacteria bacterium]